MPSLFPRRNRTKNRVFVTGAGMVTGLGLNWQENLEGLRAGRTAFRPITHFDTSKQRVHVAATVPWRCRELGSRPAPSSNRLRSEWTDGGAQEGGSVMDRAGCWLNRAALDAWAQSGWRDGRDVLLCAGTTSGGMEFGESYLRQALSLDGRNRFRRQHQLAHYQAQLQVQELARRLGISGQTLILSNACASGANAVGHGFESVRSGRWERALVGGYDALCQLVFAGFDSLQALSVTRCRPFEHDRDGLALGEGAAFFTLESENSARRRGARILGEVCGYAAVSDNHHLTQPHPEGAAALATMTEACDMAEVSVSQIGYVNAHGTGTVLNDAAEAEALRAWAGPDLARVPVSSTKAHIGHLLGAAGAVEFGICLMAVNSQWLPHQPGVTQVDPRCGFRLVQAPEDGEVTFALSNSFGFGGATASLVLKREAP